MPRRWLLSLLLALLPSVARAQARPVVHQRVVGQLGPTGVEHAVALGYRADLGDPRELLFTGAHAEVGVVNYTSPIYSISGAYLEVSPVAFLSLRAAFTGAEVWPLGTDGAGYFASQDRSLPSLAGADASHASGWNVHLTGLLQGAVPIGPLRAILWNEVTFEHVRLGEAPYHFSARHDAVLAQNDWVISSWAMALVEIPLDVGLVLRAGVYDEVRHVPSSGALFNQVGVMAMLASEQPVPEVGQLLPFVRAGIYTNHERRAGDPTLLLGAMIRYELTP
ncbi:MAG: hypothetical protein H6719_18005 [Sandaracinaceae bacterium]|nr:hypothetical protein [Sandaracinaceae bacterium]